MYTWNLYSITQQLYLNWKINGWYRSESAFGLHTLFSTLHTDLYFDLSSNVTLSWLFNKIMTLEIRQCESWYFSFVSKIKISFSVSCLDIYTFYNQTANLCSKNPVEMLTGIVFKLWLSFGGVNFLRLSGLPVHEHVLSIHFPGSPLFRQSMGGDFSHACLAYVM